MRKGPSRWVERGPSVERGPPLWKRGLSRGEGAPLCVMSPLGGKGPSVERGPSCEKESSSKKTGPLCRKGLPLERVPSVLQKLATFLRCLF